MKHISKYFTVLLFIALISGCSSSKKDVTSTGPEGITWKLETLNGSTVIPDLKDKITLSLNALTGKIDGFGGCNTFYGDYTIKNSSLTFTGIGSTKMACDDLGTESSYFSALGSTDKYTITKGTLTLFSSGKELAVFKK